jgi:dTDP-glucose 4,6-dehydratase
MIINALNARPLPIYGTGTNIRDWLYVDDHVRALFKVAVSGRIGEVYCIGARTERTNLQVAKAICALMDELAPNTAIGAHEKLVTFVADRPGHDLRYSIDATRVSTELDWRPLETFDTGLRKTVEWYLSNRGWWERIRSAVYRGERLGVVG